MHDDTIHSVRGEVAPSPSHRLLRAARAGLGLSVLDLARRAQVSVATVVLIERGERSPETGKVCRALEVAGANFGGVPSSVWLT